MSTPLWRQLLVPAFFRMAPFHVDVNSRQSGRRTVLHEFPKRDTPYAEDMGRKARSFPVTGYVIGPDYQIWRELLVAALEMEGPGLLILPTLLQRDTILVQPRDYTVRETRQQGGMAEFEMNFVESGASLLSQILDSISQLQGAAGDSMGQAIGASNGELSPGSFDEAGFEGVGSGAGSTGEVTIGDPEIGVGTP
jgi:prophage DNA circulation protein